MKSEDTRNLFLAIALSVLVMAAWQYFYAGPLYQREHQAQTQANQTEASTPRRAARRQPPARRTRRLAAAAPRPPRRRPARRRRARRDGQRRPWPQARA